MKIKVFFPSEMSRLKKKLLLYFLLVAIVSLSVSAEIILEMSSSMLHAKVEKNFIQQIEKKMPPDDFKAYIQGVDKKKVFEPIYDLRNRMVLLLIVVSLSIIGAFYLFTKDIVSPMDSMVEATKKIAEGDLTVTVPIKSEDEIGQVASLINDMNINLQDLIMQIRQEISRHMEQIIKVSYKLGEIMKEDLADEILSRKVMKKSDFIRMTKFGKEVLDILENMSDELFALQKFVKMYKTYGPSGDSAQNDIPSAFEKDTDISSFPGE